MPLLTLPHSAHPGAVVFSHFKSLMTQHTFFDSQDLYFIEQYVRIEKINNKLRDMPKFESSGAKREVPNVWGNEGDFAEAAFPAPEEKYLVKKVSEPPVPPAANEPGLQQRHAVRENIEPTELEKMLRGTEDFRLTNEIKNGPNKELVNQDGAIAEIYSNTREENIARVNLPHGQGKPGNLTENGLIRDKNIADVSLAGDYKTPQESWKKPAPARTPKPQKSFIKRLFGIN